MANSFKESVDVYVKSNGGTSAASKASQSQLSYLGDSYLGRFNFGKMYVFNYFTQKEKYYDTHPIVLGLGPSDNKNELGLNLHYMPYKIRIEFLSRIWSSYSSSINGQISGKNVPKAKFQSPLSGFTWENLKSAYGVHINLGHCVHQYKMDKIRNMRVLGYEDWYIAATNDENRFHGKSIGEAQALYYKYDI